MPRPLGQHPADLNLPLCALGVSVSDLNTHELMGDYDAIWRLWVGKS